MKQLMFLSVVMMGMIAMLTNCGQKGPTQAEIDMMVDSKVQAAVDSVVMVMDSVVTAKDAECVALVAAASRKSGGGSSSSAKPTSTNSNTTPPPASNKGKLTKGSSKTSTTTSGSRPATGNTGSKGKLTKGSRK